MEGIKVGRSVFNTSLFHCSSPALSPLGFPVRPKLTITVDTNVNSTVLRLADNAQSWKAGDRIVVASTDYSMQQAEEFQLLPCRACGPNEVKVEGRSS